MPNIPDLSKGEWLIMNRVWFHQKVTAREVTEDLYKQTEWSYNTVKTMLARLTEKGWVVETKVGGQCFYRPSVKRPAAVKQALKDFSERVLEGDMEPLVAFISKSRKLQDKDLDVLADLLKRRKKKR